MFSFISQFKKLVWVAFAQCRKNALFKQKQTCLAIIPVIHFLGEESITLSYSSYTSPLPAFLRPQRKTTHRILPPSKLIMQCVLWFNNTQSTLTKLYMLFTCFPKNINKLFRHKILFWCSIILFLSTWNTFLGNIKFFCRHEAPFHATSTCFCRYLITFCATSNILSRHINVFCATLNFCFGHRLECYVMVIYFYCHVATKI